MYCEQAQWKQNQSVNCVPKTTRCKMTHSQVTHCQKVPVGLPVKDLRQTYSECSARTANKQWYVTKNEEVLISTKSFRGIDCLKKEIDDLTAITKQDALIRFFFCVHYSFCTTNLLTAVSLYVLMIDPLNTCWVSGWNALQQCFDYVG